MASSNKPLSARSLALLAMYRGQYRRATDYLREAILINASQKAFLSEARNELFLATALRAMGKAGESAIALERAASRIKETTGQVWLTTRIGVDYARAGSADRSRPLLDKARAEADVTDPQQSSDIHRLEGEIACARGGCVQGLELLLLADQENHSPLTAESLAHAYQVRKDTAKAISAYEVVAGMSSRSLGWEAQQAWLDAQFWLADAYARTGAPGKAVSTLDQFLTRWSEGDPDLPMMVRAKRLRAVLSDGGSAAK
jgi:tetratricopeptide (TPR) repeat protein